MRQPALIALGIATFALFIAPSPYAGGDVDPRIPEYMPAKDPLAGTVASVGSDTMAYVMAFWGVEFKRFYPSVKFMLEPTGSATGPQALIEGRATVAPMSRAMTEREIDAFVKKFGYKPTEFRVGIDAVAIYVNKDNPVKELTVKQVDAIFSSTRRCGHTEDIARWGALGLGGEWASRDIVLLGRSSLSGTNQYLKEVALCGGEYKKNVKVPGGPSEIEQALAVSKNGIAYAGIGHQLPGVKALPLSRDGSGPAVVPTKATVANGTYPITRFLYVYVNKVPGKPLPALEREFLTLVLSRNGQQHLDDEGFVALSAEMAEQERAKL